MEFVDVVFPQNVGPLTYRVPPELRAEVVPGAVVEAEIRASVKRCVVLRPCARPSVGRLKALRSVVSPGAVLSPAMLRLIEWMAEYYVAPEGMVLRDMLPREFFKPSKERKTSGAVAEPQASYSGAEGGRAMQAAAGRVMQRLKRGGYEAFLCHAAGTWDEFALALRVIEGARGVIVLVPEHAGMRYIEDRMRGMFGSRLALYHSGQSRGARTTAIERMISGEADVVLGSRQAVFAPLRKVSLIVVLHEDNLAYKAESGVRLMARDVAVKRAAEEGACVLLTSICPSLESMHNARGGKYTLLDATAGASRPEVRVVDMRRAGGAVSDKVVRAARARIKRGGRVMFVINRRGYSMMQCADCHELLNCGKCQVPLVFYKAERVLRCGYCGQSERKLPDTCPACGGVMAPAGAGVERVQEELSGIGGLKVLNDDSGSLVVGTRGLARQDPLGRGAFGLSAVLNADSYRYEPDFRSSERAFRDMLYTADKTEPGGQMFLQSRSPHSGVIRFIRQFSFKRFYDTELAARAEAGYPPYSHLALITLTGGEQSVPALRMGGAVEVLGPVPGLTKRGRQVMKVLIKSPDRQALRRAVELVIKERNARQYTVDVDPIRV